MDDTHRFEIVSKFKPTGDQPEAIQKLSDGINSGKKFQVLLGATGTGKTFTIQDINNKYDVGEDGFISKEEVGEGIKKNLAKNKSLIVDFWEKSLTKERLDSITKQAGTTYILGRAENVAGDEHWVVLEGYNTNSSGQIEFTYNPTSINDYGRKFILGEPTPQQKENNYYKIDRIETFTVN